MNTKEYKSWLACYLHQNEDEVEKLLKDKTATQFLITWSLLELNLFRENGVNFEEIRKFSAKYIENINMNTDKANEFVNYFHNRYQCDKLYKNLMFKNACGEMDRLRKKDISGFSFSEKIYFSMGVVYRYRNNIFHGNKKVDSWLQYKECILKCIGMMQLLIPIPKNRPYSD
jgi:hypothetical protein